MILAQKAVDELTIKVGVEVKKVAKETAPRSEGEANAAHYKDRIVFYPEQSAVIAEQSYSAYIEYGTQPHEIRPKTAQALHFKKNGKDIFTKKVNHPGTKPNPVMRNAAKTVQKEIPVLWKQALRDNGL